MAADILSTLDQKDFNEFKKDFIELTRVHSGIDSEYSRLGKDIDKYTDEFKKAVGLFNRKYKGISIRLNLTTDGLKLRIFVKEKSVKDVFLNVASKLNGLKAIGASDFGKAGVEEADKFSKELDRVKDKLFISYFEQADDSVLLEKYKDGMIELHHGEEIIKENSPEFRICCYYAVKDGVEDIDIYEKLSAMGFIKMPFLGRVRGFFKRFNPRIEE